MPGKIAYFVLGSEGSGTHMLRNALVAAGCHWEQWFEEVDEEKLEFDGVADKLVIRRSLPHAHKWPELWKIHTKLEKAGYEIYVVFTIRDFYSSAKSVIRRGYNLVLESCYSNQFAALSFLGKYLEKYCYYDNFVYVTYEAFTGDEKYRRYLFENFLKLPYTEGFEVENRNAKYYG